MTWISSRSVGSLLERIDILLKSFTYRIEGRRRILPPLTTWISAFQASMLQVFFIIKEHPPVTLNPTTSRDLTQLIQSLAPLRSCKGTCMTSRKFEEEMPYLVRRRTYILPQVVRPVPRYSCCGWRRRYHHTF